MFVTFLQFFNDFKLIRRPLYEMSELFWNARFFSMSPADLSSLKWEADGEMSAQDTFVLVSRFGSVSKLTFCHVISLWEESLDWRWLSEFWS